ncbi:MAG TPA: DUF6090 family protein [Chryseosolibacter sp.]
MRRILHIKNQLRSPRLVRYTLYAIGEIILIVIGILIASQIDTWNEERKIKLKLRVQLNELLRELEQDVKQLAWVQDANTFRYQGFQYILRMANENQTNSINNQADTARTNVWPRAIPETFSKEYYDLVFEWMERPILYVPFSGTYDQIKSEGLFYYIMDEKLKHSIDNYYYNINWKFNEIKEATFQANNRDFINYMRNRVGIISGNKNIKIPEPKVLIKLDPIMNLNIMEMSSLALYRANNAEDSKVTALQLIDNIKRWLKESGDN